MTRKKKEVEEIKTEINVEPDAEVDSITSDENDELIDLKEIEIGSYKSHVETTKKGIFDYHIWPTITIALLSQAELNIYHRVDLRDKEFLKRIEKDLDLKIDYEMLNDQIALRPWLIYPNGMRMPKDKAKDNYEKPLTKKALKINTKKEKIQGKIDILKKKYDDMKTKKGPRTQKILDKIQGLEKKKERINK